MPTIRKLPVGLVNKIAAGEVIERPASVVKELLENSIDAGATHVEITIEGGGIELIRITDNGCGIDREQLELAVAPHATSKLRSDDDLFDVRTLGFRGEALASIAEISHMSLKSRTADEDSAYELFIKGGEQAPVRPCSGPIGTTIEIRHLFFNTPVRRKFMKSSQTEMGHVVEAFTRVALAFPHVHLVLQSGSRVVHDLPPTQQWSERIGKFFGDEIADALIPIDQRDETVSIHGYVTDPSVSRSNNRMQYLFLNGRHIRDKSLQHALGEAYRGLLMVGRMPICFLHVDIDPKSVDVNVHPTKVEVRFEDSGAIYSRLLSGLRNKFLTTDLVSRVRNTNSANSTSTIPMSSDGMSERSIPLSSQPFATLQSNAPLDRNRPSELMDWAKTSTSTLMGRVPDFLPFPPSSPNLGAIHSNGRPAHPSSLDTANGVAAHTANTKIPVPRNDPFYSPAHDSISNANPQNASPESSIDHGPPMPHNATNWTADLPIGSDAQSSQFTNSLETQRIDDPHGIEGLKSHIGFQVHNRYLVTEDEHGMVIIDQHALHERILYEQIKNKVLSKSLDVQRLLVPETITLPSHEAALALEYKSVLSDIGIEIEPFGGDTLLISSYPAMLGNSAPSEVLRQVLDPLLEGGKKPDVRNLLDELMNMIACKAAVKAGDKLSNEEITSLLGQREMYQDTHHCPHGRPTALFFSREQLDKMFKRI